MPYAEVAFLYNAGSWAIDDLIRLLERIADRDLVLHELPALLAEIAQASDALTAATALDTLKQSRKLRKAFVAALNDKALRAEADKMQLDVDPMSGDELQKLVADLYDTPPRLVERARLALTMKAQR